MIKTYPIYVGCEGPFYGVILTGHHDTLDGEDVKGALIAEIEQNLGFNLHRHNEDPAKQLMAEKIALILEAVEVEKCHCRSKVYKYDEAADDFVEFFFRLGEWPDEAEGEEENAYYDFCDAEAVDAVPVTQVTWDQDLAEQIAADLVDSEL